MSTNEKGAVGSSTPKTVTQAAGSNLCRPENTPDAARRQVVRNLAGQVCGEIHGNELRKTVSRGKHQLRTPPAWALDLAHVQQAHDAHVQTVVLRDLDDGSTWRAALDAFDKHGLRLDRGHGVQLALPLAHWQHVKPGDPVQLALFA